MSSTIVVSGSGARGNKAVMSEEEFGDLWPGELIDSALGRAGLDIAYVWLTGGGCSNYRKPREPLVTSDHHRAPEWEGMIGRIMDSAPCATPLSARWLRQRAVSVAR